MKPTSLLFRRRFFFFAIERKRFVNVRKSSRMVRNSNQSIFSRADCHTLGLALIQPFVCPWFFYVHVVSTIIARVYFE